MFLAFDNSLLSSVKAYCFQHPYETIEISHYLMLIDKDELSLKRNGRLYLYLEDEEIKALIFFNNKGVMYFSNHSEQLYKKVDFLKTIHREAPKLVKGSFAEVDKLFYFLQRALKTFSFCPCLLMEYQAETKKLFSPYVMSGSKVNWQENGNFLIEVEKFFRKDALSINYLRQKLLSENEIDFYQVYYDQQLKAQLIGEFSNYRYGILGGIYVDQKYRRKGIAQTLILAGVEEYAKRNLKSLLYVAKDNKKAINLYRKIGFVEVMDGMEMTVSL